MSLQVPHWMESFDSIKAEGDLIAGRLAAHIESVGAIVNGSANGQWVEDRLTGAVFLRYKPRLRAGDIIKLPIRACSQSGELSEAVIVFRVLRKTTFSEVQALAKKWRGARPLPIVPGSWYEVLTD